MKLKISKTHIHAIKLAIFSNFIGCAVFIIFEQVRLAVEFGFDGIDDLRFAFLLFVFGATLTSLPAIVSGYMLAVILCNYVRVDNFSKERAVFWGVILGLMTGIGLSLLALTLTNGRGSLSLYLLHFIEGAVIAAICGAWSGNKLAIYIQRTVHQE